MVSMGSKRTALLLLCAAVFAFALSGSVDRTSLSLITHPDVTTSTARMTELEGQLAIKVTHRGSKQSTTKRFFAVSHEFDQLAAQCYGISPFTTAPTVRSVLMTVCRCLWAGGAGQRRAALAGRGG